MCWHFCWVVDPQQQDPHMWTVVHVDTVQESTHRRAAAGMSLFMGQAARNVVAPCSCSLIRSRQSYTEPASIHWPSGRGTNHLATPTGMMKRGQDEVPLLCQSDPTITSAPPCYAIVENSMDAFNPCPGTQPTQCAF